LSLTDRQKNPNTNTMSNLLAIAKSIIASTPALSHWTDEVISAKVRLYRSRSEAWLRASIEKDASLIATHAVVIDSLPEHLREAARPPQEEVMEVKPKAKSRPKAKNNRSVEV